MTLHDLVFKINEEKDEHQQQLLFSELKERLNSKIDNINCPDQEENTPLHIAAQLKNLQLLQLLIAAGANLNAVNKNGDTPIHTAINFNNERALRTLKKAGAKTDEVNKQGITPFTSALNNNKLVFAKLLALWGANINYRRIITYVAPLVMANTRSKPLPTRSSIPISVNTLPREENTAVGQPVIDKPASTPISKQLPTVNVRVDNGTPLHAAIREQNYEKTELLLKLGADCQALYLYKENNQLISPLTLIAKLKLPIKWWELLFSYGAGIFGSIDNFDPATLPLKEATQNKLLVNFSITYNGISLRLSRDTDGYQNTCFDLEELKNSLAANHKHQLKAYLRAAKRIAITVPNNTMFTSLITGLDTLIQEKKLKKKSIIKPLTKLALNCILLNPKTIDSNNILPEDQQFQLDDLIDKVKKKAK